MSTKTASVYAEYYRTVAVAAADAGNVAASAEYLRKARRLERKAGAR
jgi:hypothetical protein